MSPKWLPSKQSRCSRASARVRAKFCHSDKSSTLLTFSTTGGFRINHWGPSSVRSRLKKKKNKTFVASFLGQGGCKIGQRGREQCGFPRCPQGLLYTAKQSLKLLETAEDCALDEQRPLLPALSAAQASLSGGCGRLDTEGPGRC